MKMETNNLLSSYRALDLTDVKGWLCGKLLGDLGVDVIKIEPPGGDPGRQLGPFYKNNQNLESSLYWLAYNNNKRGITLNIEKEDGKNLLKNLLIQSDFIIESFTPGYLENLGMGYSELSKINPRIIMVSITPFGQNGPRSNWKTTDLVSWAMGGIMAPYGAEDRPPTRLSHHSQAYLHAGADAAMGAMMALYWRKVNGEGQKVDISIQESVAQVAFTTPYDLIGVIAKRGSNLSPDRNSKIINHWPCKDGWISFTFSTGIWGKQASIPFIKWMEEEGVVDDFLKNIKWESFDANTASEETLQKIESIPAKFFLTRTKNELMREAAKRDIRLYPLSTVNDLLSDGQLKARLFWEEVNQEELRTSITYPGTYVKIDGLSTNIRYRAPLMGEHNDQIYGELGLSKADLEQFAKTGVI